MEDALAVGVGEAFAQLPPDVQHALDRHGRPAAQHLGEAHPGDELDGHPRLSLVVADPQDRRDVRVAEGAGGLSVAPKASDGSGLALRGGGEELDGGGPLVPGIPRDVDEAERAAAQLPADLERPERLRLVHPRSRSPILCFAQTAGPHRRVLSWRDRLMVIGIGLDLVETARVERALERFGERFVQKLMDPEEAAAAAPGRPERARRLALAVAGKEAASKALGTGWSQGVRWRDVVVSTGAEASIRLEGRAAEVARELGSSGRGRVRLEVRGPLAVGEFWLLS